MAKIFARTMAVVPSSPASANDRRPERLPRPSRTLVALQAALDAIGAPALVVGTRAEILHVSASARVLLDRDARVESSLSEAINDRASVPVWQLMKLGGPGQACGYLALLRAPDDKTKLHKSVRSAMSKWKLTARQAEVLDLVANGLTNALIAETLGIREGTAEFHLSAIFDKAGVGNRAALVARLLDGR